MQESNPNIFVYPSLGERVAYPTQWKRRMRRGDTLFFLTQVYQDTLTNQLFTVPITNPPQCAPSKAVPFNLTGAEVWFTAKNNVPDPDLAAIFELNNLTLGGVVLVTPTSGLISVTGQPLNTFYFADSTVTLDYDIQVKDSTGRVSTVEIGLYGVDPDITRSIT
jgi:hypothetical protein